MKINSERIVSALKRLNLDIALAATLTVRAAVSAATDSARGTTLFQDNTGTTRHSIVGATQGDTGFVKAGGAAHFLEYGTPPHIIAPKSASVLAFQVNGATLFRRLVHHPGSHPRPFMAHAQEEGAKAAEYGAEVYLEEAIGRFNHRA